MNWHTLSEKEVFEKLGSDLNGLSDEEIKKRVGEFGLNKLRKIRHFNALKVFLTQFKSFLIIILIFAAVLSMFMESIVDAVVIFAIIILNASLGFAQEYKAEKAIEQLKKMMIPVAKVVREGKVVKINSQDIVPGDVLVLSEGDKIMADARIFSSNGLKINEAALTGESIADEKFSKKLKLETPLADRVNMIYQGTQVVSGSCKALVVETGMRTELGKISEMVQEVQAEKNPFRQKLDHFAKTIGIFILILSAIVVGILMWTGVEVFESLLVAISLAVSAIPEGLPAVISLGLAFATRRMLKKNILVRKLPASETLGRATVICVDKTGTLTEEKMKVSSIYVNGKVNPHEGSKLLFKIGILCNKARLEKDDGKEYMLGDPTEQALIVSAKEHFLDKKKETEREPKVKEFAFTSKRKMMSVVRQAGKRFVSYAKGAPEKIIQHSNYELVNGRVLRLSEDRKKRIMKVYEKMAGEGLRVLGFAYKTISSKDVIQENAEEGLVFVGFQGMIDPPRVEVKDAIRRCNEAGVKVMMITGDGQLTADAVAKEIGLVGKSVNSIELDRMSDKQLFNEIREISIFSRIAPEDKLRIINVLKQRNEIVAMTGDGVNDALALKRADIGIAMGIRGTDVARDASDIVLVDDNFASIVSGVEEGRRIYDNTKKFIKYMLSANFDEIVLILFVIMLGLPLPLLPLQILWINLITDSFPALSLATLKPESDVMKRKPSKEGILKGITKFIVVAGFLAFLGTFLIFYLYLDNVDKARTMAVTTIVFFEMFLVFNCKSKGSVFKSETNKYVWYAVLAVLLIHLAAIYTPLGGLFYFVKLGAMDWVWAGLVAFAGFLIIEGFKKVSKGGV